MSNMLHILSILNIQPKFETNMVLLSIIYHIKCEGKKILAILLFEHPEMSKN
jgi:hypothetical protein